MNESYDCIDYFKHTEKKSFLPFLNNDDSFTQSKYHNSQFMFMEEFA
jgi:hypothetical protein